MLNQEEMYKDLISMLMTLRTFYFGVDEHKYKLIGRAMGNLIEARDHNKIAA